MVAGMFVEREDDAPEPMPGRRSRRVALRGDAGCVADRVRQRSPAVTDKESLDEQDCRVLTRLGYAVARAQLWEFAMLKLVETQRHDLAVPIDDRWAEVETWLTKWTAGKIAQEFHVPEEIAADLMTATKRRNVVAHHAWRFYIGARGKRGDAAISHYSDWLDGEARMMGHAYNGVMTIRNALAASATPLPTETVLGLWRESLPQPIAEGTIPERGEDADT